MSGQLAVMQLFAANASGMSYDKASLMGMPHILTDTCFICGRQTTNKHHLTEKGLGNKFLTLHGHKLESALISVCGSGNASGCHGKFHAHKIKVRWKWDSLEAATKWWTGEYLEAGMKPHDPFLFELGHYEICRGGEPIREIRGGQPLPECY